MKTEGVAVVSATDATIAGRTEIGSGSIAQRSDVTGRTPTPCLGEEDLPRVMNQNPLI